MATLFKHQEDLIQRNPKYHLLAWEVGTGKTAAVIRLAEKELNGCLVVCPKSLTDNWKREILKWQTGKKVWEIISKENFRKDWDILAQKKYSAIIIDESHFFGNPKSLLFKNLVKYLKKVKPTRVYSCTATPYTSSPFSIFCQEIILGKKASWIKYRYNFFYDVRMGTKIIPQIKPSAKFELAKIVAKIGSTIKKEECLDLPDKIYLQEDFVLNTEQKKVIKELKENPLVSNQITFWTKCHQISGGCMRRPENNEILYFKSDKLTRLLELIEEQKKVVVVSRYNAELEMIAGLIKKPYFVFNGKTIDRQKIIDTANETEECVFLVNAACSAGYNLTGFHTMIFYSNSFSYVDKEQISGRIHRIGQKWPCTYIELVIKSFIDEDVLISLKNKEDFSLTIYGQHNKK